MRRLRSRVSLALERAVAVRRGVRELSTSASIERARFVGTSRWILRLD